MGSDLLSESPSLNQLDKTLTQPSPQAFSARSFLDSTISCDVTETSRKQRIKRELLGTRLTLTQALKKTGKLMLAVNNLVSVQLIALFSVVSMSWRHSSFSLQKKTTTTITAHIPVQKKCRKCFTDVKSAFPSLFTAYLLTRQTCSSQIVYASVLQPHQR